MIAAFVRGWSVDGEEGLLYDPEETAITSIFRMEDIFGL